MKRIEIVLDNKVDIKEFIKVIGFVSQSILNFEYIDNKLIVYLDSEADSNEIANEINKTSQKYISSSIMERVLYSSGLKPNRFYDSFKTIHYFDEGMISLSKQAKFLYSYFETIFFELVKDSFINIDCEIVTKIYPVMLPIKAYKKTGYLKRTPQYSFFCCPLCEDFKILNEVDKINNYEYSKILNSPQYALSPSACFHVYEEYKDKKLKKNTIVTFTQNVFRNEGRFNFSEFGRMRDYHVREIVFIGDSSFVNMARERMVEQTKKLIERIGVDAKIIIASDPFILPRMQKYKKVQIVENSKYELRLSYSDSNDMSVASFNIHGSAFTHPFNISVLNKDTVTGCIGYGLERFVLAFLSQFGEEVDNWPKEIKKEYLNANNY